jgi:DNA-binding CsgD family transcriptional regulator
MNNVFQERLQSLRSQLGSVESGSERHFILLELTKLLSAVQPEEALRLAEEAYTLAQSLGDARRKALSLVSIAEVHCWLNNFSQALKYLDRARQEPTELKNVYSRILATSGLASWQMGEYDIARELLIASAEVTEQEFASRDRPAMFLTLGQVLTYSGEYKQAYEVLQKAFELARSNGWSSLEIRISAAFVELFALLNFESQSTQLLADGLELANAINDWRGIVLLHLAESSIARETGDFSRAEYAITASQKAVASEDIGIELAILFHDGMLHAAQAEENESHWEQAVESFTKVLDLAEPNQMNKWRILSLSMLANGYLELREEEKAFEALLPAYDETCTSPAHSRYRTLTSRLLTEYHCRTQDHESAFRFFNDFVQLEREQARRDMAAIANVAVAIERSSHETVKLKFHEEARRFGEIREELQEEISARNKELASHAIQVLQNNQVLKEIKSKLTQLSDNPAGGALQELIKIINEQAGRSDTWKPFEDKFRYLDPDFQKRLVSQFPELTKTEVRICMLTKLDLSPKEIAEIFALSRRTVDSQRLSIRKKLRLTRKEHLESFLRAL